MSDPWETMLGQMPDMTYWRIGDADHIVGVFAYSDPRKFSNTFLQQVHPLLPQIARELISRAYLKHVYCDGITVPRASTESMMFTVHLLRKTPLQLVDYRGDPKTVLHVGEIVLQPEIGLARFHCAYVRTDMWEIEGQTVPLVKYGGWDYLHFPIKHVDTQYPGWQSRLHFTSELGHSLHDVRDFVFNIKTPVGATASLPVIDFY